METFKLIIAGSRTIHYYFELERAVRQFQEHYNVTEPLEIVSGGAKGVDALGERLAKDYGHYIAIFPAQWNKHGKAAGYLRNKEMAEYADGCIVMWDGQSKGSKHMWDLAKEYKLKCMLLNYGDTGP